MFFTIGLDCLSTFDTFFACNLCWQRELKTVLNRQKVFGFTYQSLVRSITKYHDTITPRYYNSNYTVWLRPFSNYTVLSKIFVCSYRSPEYVFIYAFHLREPSPRRESFELSTLNSRDHKTVNLYTELNKWCYRLINGIFGSPESLAIYYVVS